MALETLTPAGDGPASGTGDVIDVLRRHADTITIRVWGGDWCGDCRSLLPPFAAALEAAGIDPATVEQYPVEKDEDGTKVGPGVKDYGIERIPTISLERDGRELVRFVESAAVPPVDVLADALAGVEADG